VLVDRTHRRELYEEDDARGCRDFDGSMLRIDLKT
jgi:hypothetical protein